MNLEKSNSISNESNKNPEISKKVKTEKKYSLDNSDLNKRSSFSQTPQPSLKNVSNDMVKIIEEEINSIADVNKEKKKHTTIIFGVNK